MKKSHPTLGYEVLKTKIAPWYQGDEALILLDSGTAVPEVLLSTSSGTEFVLKGLEVQGRSDRVLRVYKGIHDSIAKELEATLTSMKRAEPQAGFPYQSDAVPSTLDNILTGTMTTTYAHQNRIKKYLP